MGILEVNTSSFDSEPVLAENSSLSCFLNVSVTVKYRLKKENRSSNKKLEKIFPEIDLTGFGNHI
jgi:hypothetical protein